MSNFSMTRFWHLCRLRYSENRRVLVLLMLGLPLLLFAVKVICAAGIFVNGDMAVRLSRIAGITRLIGFGALMYMIVLFVDRVLRREDGIRFFTLPVTNLERYISLVVEPLVCFMVIWTVSWYIAELVWRLILSNVFPSTYAIYCSVPDTGQNLLVLFAVAAVVFNGIIMPIQISVASSRMNKIVLSIGIFLLLLVFFGFILMFSVALNSKLFAILTLVIPSLWVAVVLQRAAYRRFCQYEIDLNVEGNDGKEY